MPVEDLITQKHAVIIARDYNFVPYDPLKCERTIPRQSDIRSLFFANTSNRVKVYIQYDREALESS